MSPQQSYEVQTAISERIAYLRDLHIQNKDLGIFGFEEAVQDLKDAKRFIEVNYPITGVDK